MRRVAGLVARSAGIAVCCLLGVSYAYAGDCKHAQSLYEESQKNLSLADRKALLLRAVEECPNLAMALNNLGLVYEEEGELERAASYYQKAIDSDLELPHPYAGLGDVYKRQQNDKDAASMYQEFLRLASRESVRREYPSLSDQVLASIQDKMNQCRKAAGESTIIAAGTIEDALQQRTMRSGEASSPSKIAIYIHFNYNSSNISEDSLPQMDEIARALQSESLRNNRISIEGHTDSFGDEAYNQLLSEKRADQVKRYLIKRFGFLPGRLATRGLGESQPLDGNDTSWGRANNRRVEFVNLGSFVDAQLEKAGAVATGPGEREAKARPLMTGEVSESLEAVSIPQERLKIAILELDSLGEEGEKKTMGKVAAEMLTTAAVKSGRFDVVEREKLAQVLDELEYGESGAMQTSVAQKIGQVLGADAVLTGSVMKMGQSVRIDAHLIEVDNGKIVAAENQFANNNLKDISDAVDRLMDRLVRKAVTAKK